MSNGNGTHRLQSPSDICAEIAKTGIKLNLATLYRWRVACPLLGESAKVYSARRNGGILLDRKQVDSALSKVRVVSATGADTFEDETGLQWAWLVDAAKQLHKDGRRLSKRTLQDYCSKGCPALGGRKLKHRTSYIRFAETGHIRSRTYVPVNELANVAISTAAMPNTAHPGGAGHADWLTLAESRILFPHFRRDFLERWRGARHPILGRRIATRSEKRTDRLGRVRDCVVYSAADLRELAAMVGFGGEKRATRDTGRLTAVEAERELGIDREWLRGEIKAGRLRFIVENLPRIGPGKSKARTFLRSDLEKLKRERPAPGFMYRDKAGQFRWHQPAAASHVNPGSSTPNGSTMFKDIADRFDQIANQAGDIEDDHICRHEAIAARQFERYKAEGKPGTFQRFDSFPKCHPHAPEYDECWRMSWMGIAHWLCVNNPEKLPHDFGAPEIKETGPGMRLKTFPQKSMRERARDDATICRLLSAEAGESSHSHTNRDQARAKRGGRPTVKAQDPSLAEFKYRTAADCETDLANGRTLKEISAGLRRPDGTLVGEKGLKAIRLWVKRNPQ